MKNCSESPYTIESNDSFSNETFLQKPFHNKHIDHKRTISFQPEALLWLSCQLTCQPNPLATQQNIFPVKSKQHQISGLCLVLCDPLPTPSPEWDDLSAGPLHTTKCGDRFYWIACHHRPISLVHLRVAGRQMDGPLHPISSLKAFIAPQGCPIMTLIVSMVSQWWDH